MKLDADSGSIKVGKRPDLMLLDGNPLTNRRDLRRMTKVVRGGLVYDSAPGRAVGFERTSGSPQKALP